MFTKRSVPDSPILGHADLWRAQGFALSFYTVPFGCNGWRSVLPWSLVNDWVTPGLLWLWCMATNQRRFRDVTLGLASLRLTIQRRLWVVSHLDYHRYDRQRYSIVCEWHHTWITIITIDNDTASFVSDFTLGSISKIRKKGRKEMMIQCNSVDKTWMEYRRGVARE